MSEQDAPEARGLVPRRPGLTIRQRERLERLFRRYEREPLPADITQIIRERLDVDISSRYGPLPLRCPLLVAPGDITGELRQLEKAAECGWGGVVLRTIAAEDASGACSLAHLRDEAGQMGPRSIYHRDDTRRAHPAVEWNARLDPRTLPEYVEFVRAGAAVLEGTGAALVASLEAGADGQAEASHTAAALLSAGVPAMELLVRRLCGDVIGSYGADMEGARPRIIASGLPRSPEDTPAELRGFLLAYGRLSLDLRSGGRPLRAARGGALLLADTIAGWGLAPVELSVAGGVYTGRDALSYIVNGASTVQVYSFLAGKVRAPLKRSLNKFDQALHVLLLDPMEGLVAGLVHLKNALGVSSVADAVGLAHRIGQ